MAVPKRRTSKSKKRMRRGHHGFEKKHLIDCENCGKLKENHHICIHCGYYNKRIYSHKKLIVWPA